MQVAHGTQLMGYWARMGQAHPENAWPPRAPAMAETCWEQGRLTARVSCSWEGQTESE